MFKYYEEWYIDEYVCQEITNKIIVGNSKDIMSVIKSIDRAHIKRNTDLCSFFYDRPILKDNELYGLVINTYDMTYTVSNSNTILRLIINKEVEEIHQIFQSYSNIVYDNMIDSLVNKYKYYKEMNNNGKI